MSDKTTFSEDMDKFFKDNKINYDAICFDVLEDVHFDTEAVALYRLNESVIKNVKRIYYLNKCLSDLKEEAKNPVGKILKCSEIEIYISLSKSALSAIRSKICSLRDPLLKSNYSSLEEAIIADSCDIALLDNLYEYAVLQNKPIITRNVKLAGEYVSAYKRSDDCKKVLDVLLFMHPNGPTECIIYTINEPDDKTLKQYTGISLECIIYTINELDDKTLKQYTDISLQLIEKGMIGALYTLFATRAPLSIASNKKRDVSDWNNIDDITLQLENNCGDAFSYGLWRTPYFANIDDLASDLPGKLLSEISFYRTDFGVCPLKEHDLPTTISSDVIQAISKFRKTYSAYLFNDLSVNDLKIVIKACAKYV